MLVAEMAINGAIAVGAFGVATWLAVRRKSTPAGWSTRAPLFAIGAVYFLVSVIVAVSRYYHQATRLRPDTVEAQWARPVGLAVQSLVVSFLLGSASMQGPPAYVACTLLQLATFVLLSLSVLVAKVALQATLIIVSIAATVLWCITLAGSDRREAVGSRIACIAWALAYVFFFGVIVNGHAVNRMIDSFVYEQLVWSLTTAIGGAIVLVASVCVYLENEHTSTIVQWFHYVLISGQFAPERAKAQ
jgi:hypothetical protein